VKTYSNAAIQDAQIVDRQGGKFVEITAFPNQGEVITFDMVSDKPKSKRKSVFIQQGESGKSILLRKWQSVEHQANGKTSLKVANITEYPDEKITNGIETAYRYEWHTDSKKIRRQTVLLPVIRESENGDGLLSRQTEIFDTKCRTIWSQNETEIISHYVYDSVSGKLLRQIDDVDTTKISDFGTEIPEGWQTPEDSGKHAITDYCYDFKGRLIKTIHPVNEGIDDNGQLICCRPVTWNVYDDLNQPQCSASGYLELDSTGNRLRTVFVNSEQQFHCETKI
jgi:hypothetical protein